jgi:2',3'-cyclic-nucleotide 2'-phosphodiesterase (5'-nucleotidase family)
LCFKDPAESILHYYDELAAVSDVLVVLSHLGYTDGGYGYGLSVYGDQTLAGLLNDAGKPVDLIIGGHSHTNLSAATVVDDTTIVQAYYNGRRVGRADITVDSGDVSINWRH